MSKKSQPTSNTDGESSYTDEENETGIAVIEDSSESSSDADAPQQNNSASRRNGDQSRSFSRSSNHSKSRSLGGASVDTDREDGKSDSPTDSSDGDGGKIVSEGIVLLGIEKRELERTRSSKASKKAGRGNFSYFYESKRPPIEDQGIESVYKTTFTVSIRRDLDREVDGLIVSFIFASSRRLCINFERQSAELTFFIGFAGEKCTDVFQITRFDKTGLTNPPLFMSSEVVVRAKVQLYKNLVSHSVVVTVPHDSSKAQVMSCAYETLHSKEIMLLHKKSSFEERKEFVMTRLGVEVETKYDFECWKNFAVALGMAKGRKASLEYVMRFLVYYMTYNITHLGESSDGSSKKGTEITITHLLSKVALECGKEVMASFKPPNVMIGGAIKTLLARATGDVDFVLRLAAGRVNVIDALSKYCKESDDVTIFGLSEMVKGIRNSHNRKSLLPPQFKFVVEKGGIYIAITKNSTSNASAKHNKSLPVKATPTRSAHIKKGMLGVFGDDQTTVVRERPVEYGVSKEVKEGQEKSVVTPLTSGSKKKKNKHSSKKKNTVVSKDRSTKRNKSRESSKKPTKKNAQRGASKNKVRKTDTSNVGSF